MPLLISFSFFACGEIVRPPIPVPDAGLYMSPEELYEFLLDINNEYPEITSIESIGKSVEGRDIWAFVVGKDFQNPRIRITGEIHGDEFIGQYIITSFIEYITSLYDTDENIKSLIDERCIVFIPQFNPDGVVAGERYNANRVDLNRNFSAAWRLGSTHGSQPFSEPETQAFRDYSISKIFHLSVTYHSGATIINMPFDYISESRRPPFGRPQRYDLVRYIAEGYSNAGFNRSPDILSIPYGDSNYVKNAIVNGGDWYIITGSLQDWSYLETGCLDYTIEAANYGPFTFPEADLVFENNKNSLIKLIELAGMGVSGTITDKDGNPLKGVKVYFDDDDLITESDDFGYYHKILQDGSYILNFDLNGEIYSTTVSVYENELLDVVCGN
jgi:carboxypeptidase D